MNLLKKFFIGLSGLLLAASLAAMAVAAAAICRVAVMVATAATAERAAIRCR